MFQKKEEEINLTISTGTFIKLALMVVATFILLSAIQKASHALILIFSAFFLALALNAPVQWISNKIPGKKKGSRAIAVSISYLIVIIVLGSFIAYISPPLIKQTQNLISTAPSLINEVHNKNSAIGGFIRRYKLEGQVNKFSTQLENRLQNSTGAVFSTISNISSSLFSLVTVLVLTFMMLVEGKRWINLLFRLLPKNSHNKIQQISKDMYSVIKGFVNGQVILALLAAILILPALLLLHISYPAALFFVIFVCGLIPMVGHTIGAIIITIVSLLQSTTAGLIIFSYYILYQQIENYLIQPKIQSNTTNLSPLMVLLALFIGVSFDGLLGGLVAIPIVGCLRIAVLDFMKYKKIL